MIRGLDFETELARAGCMAPPPACLAWARDSEAGLVHWTEAEEVFVDALSASDPVTFLNAPFDLAVGCATWPQHMPLVFDAFDREIVFDVGTRQKLIDIATGDYYMHRGQQGLQGLARRLLDRELDKGEDTWRLRYGELRPLPLSEWPQEAIDYPVLDVRTTVDCHVVQETELAEMDRLAVLVDQHRQCRADFALYLMRCWGLRTNPEGVARLRRMCEEQQAALEQQLLSEGLLRQEKKKGVVSVVKCVNKVKERLFTLDPGARLAGKGLELRAGGAPESVWHQAKYVSVDKEACADSGDDLLEAYSEYAQIGTMLSGVMKTLERGVNEPIHSHFEVLMDTGRTSSSDPPVQNLGRKEGPRECFEPSQGHCYVGCDIDKAELHSLAQCCIDLFNFSVLGDALNSGYDPHVGLGARLAHTTYDDLKARIKAGDKEMKEWRQRAKPGNFGLPGGMGARGLQRYSKKSYGVVMTLEECEYLIDGWREQWPCVAERYLGWVHSLVEATGYATIEHFVSGRWRGRVPFCAAANSFFQGRTADAMKAALFEVTKRCYVKHPGSALFGCRPVNFIHDEIIAEAPLDRASDAAWEMRDVIVKAYNRFTPDVPARSTPVLMDRLSKNAEHIVDAAGNLQVWHYVPSEEAA